MTDRLIRLTTALAVVAVASVVAIISYQHAYELVRTHGESSLTAQLLPFTVDGLEALSLKAALDDYAGQHADTRIAPIRLIAPARSVQTWRPGVDEAA